MKILLIIIGILLPFGLMAQLTFISGSYSQQTNRTEMVWQSLGTFRVDSVVVYRADKANRKYAAVPAKIAYESKPDTVFFTVTDSTVQRYAAYDYYLMTRYAGEQTLMATDTVFVAALDFMEMPMPDHITAVPGEGGRGIHIGWQLKNAPLVKQLTLYRSTNSVDGFEAVATLPLDRNAYTDMSVRPATPYFYYFTLEYKTQDVAKRGPSFAASFTDDTPPPPVTHIEAMGTADGVQLDWHYDGEHTTGFWLYRGQADGPLELLSTLIPSIDTIRQYSYVDTDTLLNGAREYQYAIKSYSTSHVEGAFSDTVSARPLKNIPVPKAPLSITALADEADIFVSWEDVAAVDEWVSGYTVLRSALLNAEKGEYTPPDTLFTALNFYVDSLIKPGVPYKYSVIAHSDLGVRSAPSIEVTAALGVVRSAAPGTLLATVADGGVLLQWGLPQGGEAYRYGIYRFVRGQEAMKIATTREGADTYTDATAVRDTEYFYFVRTLDGDNNESSNSNESRVVY